MAKWKELGVGVMATYQLPELKHRPPPPPGSLGLTEMCVRHLWHTAGPKEVRAPFSPPPP